MPAARANASPRHALIESPQHALGHLFPMPGFFLYSIRGDNGTEYWNNLNSWYLSQQEFATGGGVTLNPGYEWSLSSGVLPEGITLVDGLISGTAIDAFQDCQTLTASGGQMVPASIGFLGKLFAITLRAEDAFESEERDYNFSCLLGGIFHIEASVPTGFSYWSGGSGGQNYAQTFDNLSLVFIHNDSGYNYMLGYNPFNFGMGIDAGTHIPVVSDNGLSVILTEQGQFITSTGASVYYGLALSWSGSFGWAIYKATQPQLLGSYTLVFDHWKVFAGPEPTGVDWGTIPVIVT